ncbi:MAG: prolipoprotein diacylglyceryl transferase [Gammaproteobacteria bacterium]|nr:prolipoprotein diacylglyceryl transferase [Gammaproteobacteria bacterium]
MLKFPDIDPVAVQLGPLAIHWYGIAYLVGIGAGWMLLSARAARPTSGWSGDEVADLIFYSAFGAVLGGRIGYGLFYNFGAYLQAPWELLAVWRGGMSFHGGIVGGMLALWLFARRRQRAFLQVSDFMLPAVPIGLCLGRIANFVNQELWGAPSTLPWAVVFTHPAAGGVPRHPSQLYEAALEGILLFVVLNCLCRKPRRIGSITATFLIGYAIIRLGIEFVREPDAHIGYLVGHWLTLGQVLSMPMLLGGLAILLWVPARSISALEKAP